MTSLRKLLPSANALFVFEAAARELSFTKAAAELNVTQPAVSRMLGRLERHLGARLFERSVQGVVLTESGRILYRSIAAGFRGVEGALDEIRQRRTGLETVTLSVSSGFTTHWLMPRIGALQTACPNLDLRFQLIPGALKGPVDTVDLGMRFVEGQDASPGSVFFVNEVTVPVCSPAYLAGRVAGKTQDTFINLADSSTDWIAPLRQGQFRPGQHSDLLHVSDYAVVLQAALLGQGIALGWINVVSQWLKTGALVPAGPKLVRTSRRCHLVCVPHKEGRPTLMKVRDWLVAEMRADLEAIETLHPGWGIRDASL
ncbi:LysR family transcriptional regulator [Lichenihabitans psoromatis]|uniref:LysR family transcriptional regulator n=1 Tax=Lichenihabitans psoromatis TaxID=2528642 RepID=UPI001036B6B0|nr:LysR family transcriptional regulator [Lichenihabitans psoromatis]